MLLYDQINEMASRKGMTDSLSLLRILPVYELTSVVGLFEDWKRESENGIPKTPPHDALWAEWQYDGTIADVPATSTLGCIILGDPAPTCGEWPDRDGTPRLLKVSHLCVAFARLDRMARPIQGLELNLPTVLRSGVALFLGDNDSESGTVLNVVDSDVTVAYANEFDLPLADLGRALRPEYYWPAFMAFSLLHHTNVVAEDNPPDARLQRRVIKAGRPPRATFKTIKIEVPRTVHDRQNYDGREEDGGPKVRYHLCRGHSRLLRSERYKDNRGKRVWVPSHFRGSQDLGTVTTVRKLVPAQKSVEVGHASELPG